MDILKEQSCEVLGDLIDRLPECIEMACPAGIPPNVDNRIKEFKRISSSLIERIRDAESALNHTPPISYSGDQVAEHVKYYQRIRDYANNQIQASIRAVLDTLNSDRAVRIAISAIESQVLVLVEKQRLAYKPKENDFAEFQSALIIPETAKDPKSIIRIFSPVLRFLDKCISEPGFLYHFSKHHRDFEVFIADCYYLDGWDKVELTPQRNDGGRDVIATRSDIGTVRILEQTKAYSHGKLVTHDDVRNMLGVLSIDRSASKGIITTTSDFQPNVKSSPEFTPYMPSRLELRNGYELRRWLASIKAKST